MRNRLFVLLSLITLGGCAASFATVPADRWQIVPDGERAAIDQRNAAQLVVATTAEKAAATQVATAERGVAGGVVARRTPAPVPATSDPAEAASRRAQADREAKAMTRVDRAQLAWRRATLTWHQRRLDAARARVVVVRAELEHDRAYAVDRKLPSDETYDVTTFRGQLANAQLRWYEATTRIDQARTELTAATRELAAAKEAYSALLRMPEPLAVAAAESASMQLTAWTSAGVKRRGMKVIAVSGDSCRRNKCFRSQPHETAYLKIVRR